MQEDGFFFKVFTFSKVQDIRTNTSNLTNQGHVWQCKERYGYKFPIQKVYVFFQEIC
jgi:hypothetical protein